MPRTVNMAASGISPAFPIGVEEFKLWQIQAVTRTGIDGVEPPILGPGGGYSGAMGFLNQWFPWIDEPLVVPKYDGIAMYLGIPSNRPTYIKSYHTIALMRAVDAILTPFYTGRIMSQVGTVTPAGAPTQNGANS